MLRRTSFWFYWPHTICGLRARFIALRFGAAYFLFLWDRSAASSVQLHLGMPSHIGFRVWACDISSGWDSGLMVAHSSCMVRRRKAAERIGSAAGEVFCKRRMRLAEWSAHMYTAFDWRRT